MASRPLLRWAPPALFALAVLHCIVAVVDPVWVDMLQNGLLGAAENGSPLVRAESGFALYFLATGVMLLAAADAAASHLAVAGTLPPRLGWYVLALGLLITVVQFPLNGGWLVVPVGIAILALDRRS